MKLALSISHNVASLNQAESIYINQIVYDLRRQGCDVTALSLGEAFFDIPMMDFEKLDFSRGYHYSDSQGLPELRSKIADYYHARYNAHVSAADEVLISAGSKAIIYMAMLATLEPGSDVLIHEPAWLSYPEQAKLVGATPRFIPYDTPIELFPSYFGELTKMLVINNPNNPAGRLYTIDELTYIYDQCRSRGIYVLIDEAYSDFVYGDDFHSMAKLFPSKDGIIIVNSLSKNLGISGWRIGYVISDPQVIQHLLKINQHIITCAPTVLQQYCNRYFDEILAITLPQVRDLIEKRNRVAKMLKKLNLPTLPGGATFYFFVSIGDYQGKSNDFALSLLTNYHIAVVPGSAYGSSTDRFIRISIGTESEERIWEALVVIKNHITSKSRSANSAL